MLETSAGSAKYEHAFHSLVWRIPKLPKEGQGMLDVETTNSYLISLNIQLIFLHYRCLHSTVIGVPFTFDFL